MSSPPLPSPTATLTFDVACHSLDAVQRAAYRFCDRASIDVRKVGDEYLCSIYPAAGVVVDQALLDGLRTEVLDQTLRERIRRETESVRNVILSIAFSRADVND